ncbi:hypothetical protein HanIR_Chr09g0409231 [Helianthus annuus]|nr:hypothetical protein HanIR_Chr09g0409231 [Helianthus annuus]
MQPLTILSGNFVGEFSSSGKSITSRTSCSVMMIGLSWPFKLTIEFIVLFSSLCVAFTQKC